MQSLSSNVNRSFMVNAIAVLWIIFEISSVLWANTIGGKGSELGSIVVIHVLFALGFLTLTIIPSIKTRRLLWVFLISTLVIATASLSKITVYANDLNVFNKILFLAGLVAIISVTYITLGKIVALWSGGLVLLVFMTDAGASVLFDKHIQILDAAGNIWTRSDGLFGSVLEISTLFIFSLICFSVFLDRCGLPEFLERLLTAIYPKQSRGIGGTFTVSAISASVIGSSNSHARDSVPGVHEDLTSAGVSPNLSAGVLANISTVAQFCPPVMGAGLFIISSGTGIPYSELMLKTLPVAILALLSLYFIICVSLPVQKYFLLKFITKILLIGTALFLLSIPVYILAKSLGSPRLEIGVIPPAIGACLLYISWLFSYRHCGRLLISAQTGISPITENRLVNAWVGGHTLIPILLLIFLLLFTTASLAETMAVAFMLVIFMYFSQSSFTQFFLGKEQVEINAEFYLEASSTLGKACERAAYLVVALTLASLFLATLTIFGLGNVISFWLLSLVPQGFLLVIISMAVIVFVFGLGLPPTASYLVGASLLTGFLSLMPSSQEFAVTLFSLHLFIFIMAALADVTPPDAPSIQVVSDVTNLDYNTVKGPAIMASVPIFFLAFSILGDDRLTWNPEIGGLAGFFEACIVSLLGLLALILSFSSHLSLKVPKFVRGILFLAAMGLLFPRPIADTVWPPIQEISPSNLVQASPQNEYSIKAQLMDSKGGSRILLSVIENIEIQENLIKFSDMIFKSTDGQNFVSTQKHSLFQGQDFKRVELKGFIIERTAPLHWRIYGTSLLIFLVIGVFLRRQREAVNVSD